MMIEKIDEKELIKMSLKMRERAYTPYSHFSVGAVLLSKNGEVFTGCNIESNTFTPTCCAERTAFFKAVSEGVREFDRIYISGGIEGKDPTEFCPPCGVCRQLMSEFCDEDFKLILVKSESETQEHTLGELLPLMFTQYKSGKEE